MIRENTDDTEAARNAETRQSTDRLLSYLQRVHGEAAEIRVTRTYQPRHEHKHDNGANERNAAPPLDFGLVQAVSLLDS